MHMPEPKIKRDQMDCFSGLKGRKMFQRFYSFSFNGFIGITILDLKRKIQHKAA